MDKNAKLKRQVYPTITQSFMDKVRHAADKKIFHHKDGRDWNTLTWSEYYNEIQAISLGLLECGVRQGQTVSILANTRLEWAQCDMAIFGAKAVSVPVYASNTFEEVKVVLNHAQVRVVIVEDNRQLEKIFSCADELPHVTHVVVMVFHGNQEIAAAKLDGKTLLTLEQLKKSGKKSAMRKKIEREKELKPDSGPRDEIARNLLSLKSTDVFTICYTSGTTGIPKGVVLTYDALASMMEDIESVMGGFFKESDVVLSFLPYAHIFGRVESMAVYHFGWRVYFAENIEKLFNNIQEVKPTLLFAVPRIFEKAFIKIQSIVEETAPLGRFLFEHALRAGRDYHEKINAGVPPSLLELAKYEIAKKTVFKNIYKKFGGKLRLCIAGGAPLPSEIGEFMQIIGVTILEGYGLTETCAAVTLNPVENPKFGTIGKALPEVSVRIASDGEILIKSRKVMREYFKSPEDTRAVIDAHGYLHTGDIGEIDRDGYIRITDRKKDIIVTSGGKNIAPQKIENLLKTDKFINQVVVLGDKKNYLVALIALNHEEVIKYANETGILFSEYTGLVKNPKLIIKVQKIIDALNAKLASYETVKKIKILPNEFTVDSGELTPSLKIKRKLCSEKYASEIEALYAEELFDKRVT